jgi:two-component sensor histidine kinase/CheY-like chemotaxis protein
MNVLIVDDQEPNRYLLKALFTGAGHRAEEAPDGKAALEKLETGKFDLVISDILMPVMDGYQLCREVRSRENLKGLPFVFLTATYVDEKDEIFALKLGADRFLRKPFNPRALLEEIKSLVAETGKNKGTRAPAVPADEKEILTLYNERLIHKLEAKMMSLEKEIADRELAEEKLRRAVSEKEALLREIHHRVKNNMQIISSLINLSSRSFTDPALLAILRDVKSRIRTMSMIHEKLLRSEDLVHIDFAEFLNDLAIHYFQYYKADPGRIELTTEAEPVKIAIEAAVPCGMIAGELISNALRHAFPADRRGKIVVGLKRLGDNEVELSVRDEGVGIHAEMDIRKHESAGMTIINALVGQINGRLEIRRDNGTDFRVVFPSAAC